MNGALFTVSEALKEGWKLTKEHLSFFIGYQIVLWLLVYIHYVTHNTPWSIVSALLIILAKMGLYKSALLITSGVKPGFNQFYQNWRQFLSWVISNFLFALMFIFGLILFIIPGLYVLAKYGLFPYFLLDKDLGPLEALNRTGDATVNSRWKLFLLFMACLGLNILGIIVFGIGTLISVPVTLLALAFAYRQITWAAERTRI